MARVASVLAAAVAVMTLATGLAACRAEPSATIKAAPASAVAPSAGMGKAGPSGAQTRPKATSDQVARQRRQFRCVQRARARRLHFAKRRAFMRACLSGRVWRWPVRIRPRR